MKRVIWDRPAEVGAWVCERLNSVFDPLTGTAIGQERDGQIVGGVVYDNFRGASICMHVAGSDGHWMSREFLRAVFGYPFDQLGVKKVLGTVDSPNVAAQQFDEHLGFVLEATLRDAGRGGDLLIYSMTRAQCRHLR